MNTMHNMHNAVDLILYSCKRPNVAASAPLPPTPSLSIGLGNHRGAANRTIHYAPRGTQHNNAMLVCSTWTMLSSRSQEHEDTSTSAKRQLSHAAIRSHRMTMAHEPSITHGRHSSAAQYLSTTCVATNSARNKRMSTRSHA